MSERLEIIQEEELERTKINGIMTLIFDGKKLEHICTKQINHYMFYAAWEDGMDSGIRMKAPRSAQLAARHKRMLLEGNEYTVQVDYYQFRSK
jgi:hypothetical protein